ncbi:hypothetical protein P885DRAFT_64735 [Corynascus similis CBS 632.67]
MSEQIVLFDLPSKEPRRCWSLNPWKTRLLLNYKGLDYRTEWVEYPDIKSTLEPHLPPRSDWPAYTIPAVRLADGTYVMDSLEIARAIEAAHPSPPLHLDSPALARLIGPEGIASRTISQLARVLLTRVPTRILTDASVPYWVETRSQMVGMPLAEFQAQVTDWEPVWAAAEPVLHEATALLNETREDGPFFLGKEASYADFVWGGLLIFYDRMGELDELLARTGDAEAHKALLKALEPWTERCDF